MTRPHFIHGAGLQSSQDLGVGVGLQPSLWAWSGSFVSGLGIQWGPPGAKCSDGGYISNTHLKAWWPWLLEHWWLWGRPPHFAHRSQEKGLSLSDTVGRTWGRGWLEVPMIGHTSDFWQQLSLLWNIFSYIMMFLDVWRRMTWKLIWPFGQVVLAFIIYRFTPPLPQLRMLEIKAAHGPQQISLSVTRWQPNTRIESVAWRFFLKSWSYFPPSPLKIQFTGHFKELQPVVLQSTDIQKLGLFLCKQLILINTLCARTDSYRVKWFK